MKLVDPGEATQVTITIQLRDHRAICNFRGKVADYITIELTNYKLYFYFKCVHYHVLSLFPIENSEMFLYSNCQTAATGCLHLTIGALWVVYYSAACVTTHICIHT